MNYQRIITVTCEEFGISLEEFQSRCRFEHCVIARHIATYLCLECDYRTDKFKEIGLLTGGRKRATVYHSYKTVNDLMFWRFNGRTIKDYIESIRRRCSPIFEYADTIPANIL